MRILTVVANLDLRGTQRAAQTFSCAYKRAGHEVAVLAHVGGGPRQQILENNAIPVFLGETRLKEALRAANDFAPDVIHIHRQGHSRVSETRILDSLRYGARVVIETNVFGRVDYSVSAGLIDVHMSISAFCLWRWQRRLGASRGDQIGVLVPNPVETGNFQRRLSKGRSKRSTLSIPDDAFVCGHIGFKASPRVFEGFEALAVRDRSAWMVCVGLPGSTDSRFQALPRSVKERVVRVPQAQDDNELCSLYSTFDCLLHAPTIGETFGYVPAEALLCGVPVAGLSRPHHDNGHLEVIGHREGGLIAGSSNRFADAVLALRSDDLLREFVQREGPKRIRQLFDADLIADRALRVATHALVHRDRGDLRRALEEDPSLQTHVDDRFILELTSNTLGGPSGRELALMHLLNWAPCQRFVRLLRHRELAALRP